MAYFDSPSVPVPLVKNSEGLYVVLTDYYFQYTLHLTDSHAKLGFPAKRFVRLERILGVCDPNPAFHNLLEFLKTKAMRSHFYNFQNT